MAVYFCCFLAMGPQPEGSCKSREVRIICRMEWVLCVLVAQMNGSTGDDFIVVSIEGSPAYNSCLADLAEAEATEEAEDLLEARLTEATEEAEEALEEALTEATEEAEEALAEALAETSLAALEAAAGAFWPALLAELEALEAELEATDARDEALEEAEARLELARTEAELREALASAEAKPSWFNA